MRSDNRLPRVLHALLHLEQMDGPVTSDQIGEMLATNPSVVRRTMAGLRQSGLVESAKGHGGGWRLTRPLTEISLLEVYQALGSPALFALGVADDAPQCLLEQAANAATKRALAAAQEVFLARLAEATVAEVTVAAAEDAPVVRTARPG